MKKQTKTTLNNKILTLAQYTDDNRLPSIPYWSEEVLLNIKVMSDEIGKIEEIIRFLVNSYCGFGGKRPKAFSQYLKNGIIRDVNKLFVAATVAVENKDKNEFAQFCKAKVLLFDKLK
jgi:hypothetical protein